MKILILRVSAIGDVIHTLPAIFLIKKIFPNAKISWVVQEKAADLLQDQPFLENIFVLPNKFLTFKNWKKSSTKVLEIRKTKWDAILDFQGILKTSVLAAFLKGKKYGFSFKHSRLWLTSFFTDKHTKPDYQNIIQKNLALASDMLMHKTSSYKSSPTITELKKLFKLKIPQNNKNIINNWLEKNNITKSVLQKFILLAPNTTWDSKHWPQENWEILFNLLLNNKSFVENYSIVLVGKGFGEQAKKLSQKISNQNLNIFTTPNFNLLSTCYLISKSNLLIAPDTGILHLADFLDKKSIGIFGPTHAKKHGPFINSDNIENVIQIKCPHHYQKTHGKSTGKDKKTSINQNCMYKLSPEKLCDQIFKVLNLNG